ncbi:GNAT family N-acetyltransferase [Algoriphagus terrigena]|uniref:GNAT family N-acetyltransferase n=1 Tax=Algoriphagus terrigena TaxID=344884 RepID=UPI0003F911BA|nr:GNAT family N-acetyltransferase [Algoriphagus terrigena]
MKKEDSILISEFSEEHSHYFGSLNREWIQKFYTLEPADLELLDHPRQTVIDTGGAILFASYRGTIIGTVGLRLRDSGQMEMIKLAVKEEHRGLGAGKLLCLAAMQKAESMGADKMVLYSNTLQEKAIALYRRLGFVERPVEKGVYARANIKMEFSFRKDLQRINWFDRKFEFNTGVSAFESLAERLAGSPGLFMERIGRASEEGCQRKPEGKWSVKEHLGHLSVLEPVWRLRFQDIREEKPVMGPADLSNRATHEGDFNKQSLEILCGLFQEERNRTLYLLSGFPKEDLQKTSRHPRLQQRMNCCDLMLFVAEHDLHHLNPIHNLLNDD